MASTPAASNRSIIIRLNIASEELLKLYRGSAREVVATSLKPFVTHNGVQGQFTLLVDANNKLIDLRRY
jgi:hypothetical protein